MKSASVKKIWERSLSLIIEKNISSEEGKGLGLSFVKEDMKMKGLRKWIWMIAMAISLNGFVLLCPESNAQRLIQIKGSDSEVNLVQRLAEVFMKKNPEENVAVTGGGSGTGIAALIKKTTDIANSSRAMEPKEEEATKKAGRHPFRIIFRTDGISVVTHP